MMDKFQKFLTDYDLPTNYTGFAYMKAGLLLMSQDPTASNKFLFLTLATQFNTNEKNIERCLRFFVEKSWTMLPQLFDTRPTIREFLTKCVEHIDRISTTYTSVYAIFE
jgi:hypothetical protein